MLKLCCERRPSSPSEARPPRLKRSDGGQAISCYKGIASVAHFRSLPRNDIKCHFKYKNPFFRCGYS